MPTVRLRTGTPLTRFGLGGAQLGNLGRVTTDEQARSAVDTAWDRGARQFDTAPHYGLGYSERRLGALLADRPRDEYVLSTKAGRTLVPQDHAEGQLDDGGFAVPAAYRRAFDFSRDAILRGVESSYTYEGEVERCFPDGQNASRSRGKAAAVIAWSGAGAG